VSRRRGSAERAVQRLARAVAVLIPARYRADVWSDLADEHRERIGRGEGRATSAAWLVAQLVRAAAASRWHGRGLGRSALDARTDRRTQQGSGTMGDLRRDVAYAVRTLVRAPVFTAVALLTLSVGLGATIAVYTVVNGVLLRPLPYEDPDRLVFVRGGDTGRGAITFPDYADLRETSAAFADLVVWQGWSVIRDDAEGVPTRRTAASVSWRFFRMLGVQPAAGRFFVAEEGAPGHAPVVVLSHAAWLREFGGRADAIGQPYAADDGVYTVVGIAPEHFIDPVAYASWGSAPEAWRADPPVFSREAADRGWIGFWAIGRLRGDATIARAQAAVDALIESAYADVDPLPRARVVEVLADMVADVRRTLLVFQGAVALVLLIACANVANLMLSRAAERGREMAVRRALGASRGRLLAQLLTESLLLSTLAGAAGILLAVAGARALVAQAGAGLPRSSDVFVDWRVALAALAVAKVTALVFGLAPALQLTGGGAAARLRERGRAGGAAGQRTRTVLVVAETALAVLLLVGAGLLLRTFWTLQRIDTGFEPASALAVRIELPEVSFPTAQEQRLALAAAVAEAAASPGIVAAGAITDLPMSGAVNSTTVYRTDVARPAPGQAPHVLVRGITPAYFDAMRVPVLRGRAFAAGDRDGTPPVAIVNERFVTVFFPGEDAIGRTVEVRGTTRAIVGVVRDVKEFTLTGGPDAALYEPFSQVQQSWMRVGAWVVARADGGTPPLAADVRQAVRRAHPRIPITTVRPLGDVVAADIAAPRFRARLVALFGGVALLLAAVGVGGVMACIVAQRRREIGLRLAVGATSADITRMIAAESARLTGAGVVLGLLAAAAAARLIAGFLFGVPPVDPIVFAAVAATLALVALAASIIPARRAAAIDPSTTLRAE
jgi:putative ABC transport system permease protein